MGASPARIVWRIWRRPRWVSSARRALQLLPAAILAETTLSFAGLGFAPDAPSWGTLLARRRDLASWATPHGCSPRPGRSITVVFAINLASLSIDPAHDPR